ncbi:MAG: hypothetical protein JJU33_02665 [Phycisphaerales bacterium]|nr:hypothetical protein [Phycisphaerales bacterium]
MNALGALPAREREAVSAKLDPDERVLWASGPSKSASRRRLLYLSGPREHGWLVLLLLIAPLLIAGSAVSAMMGPDRFPLVLVEFGLLFLIVVLIFFAMVAIDRRPRRTSSVVTEKRLFVINSKQKGETGITACDLANLKHYAIHKHHDGSADLIFRAPRPPALGKLEGLFGLQDAGKLRTALQTGRAGCYAPDPSSLHAQASQDSIPSEAAAILHDKVTAPAIWTARPDPEALRLASRRTILEAVAWTSLIFLVLALVSLGFSPGLLMEYRGEILPSTTELVLFWLVFFAWILAAAMFLPMCELRELRRASYALGPGGLASIQLRKRGWILRTLDTGAISRVERLDRHGGVGDILVWVSPSTDQPRPQTNPSFVIRLVPNAEQAEKHLVEAISRSLDTNPPQPQTPPDQATR